MILTSGIFGDLYIVNEKYYPVRDDIICFKWSKSYHSLPEDCFIEKDSYEIKYGKAENTKGNNFVIFWHEKDEPYVEIFRVYKIHNME